METLEIRIDTKYAMASDFIDRHVGLMNAVFRIRPPMNSPNSFMFGGRSCSPKNLFPGRVVQDHAPWSTGINIDYRKAFLGCLFETVERYCSAVVDDEHLLWGSERDLRSRGLECMSSSIFDYFTDEQYASSELYERWTPDSKLRWKSCVKLSDSKQYFVPAQLVYIPYVRMEGEPYIFDCFSTGLAAHRTIEQATYAGLCEVIERDAFLIYWQKMLKSPTIRLETIRGKDREIDELLNRANELPNVELLFKDLTSDLCVPTPLFVLRNKKDIHAPAAGFAAATDLDYKVAIRKALNECFGTYYYAHRLRQLPEHSNRHTSEPQHWENTDHLDDHVLNFAYHNIHEFLGWLDEGIEISLDDLLEKHHWSSPLERNKSSRAIAMEATLEIARRVKEAGLECVYGNITSNDVAANDFVAARAIIPGSVPLHASHKLRPRGCRRFNTVPLVLGITCSEGFNPLPHPYP
jgi:ribosomal protein S12 methylthiotransferase accessory factor